MSKSSKKYVLVNSYKKIAFPVEFLPQFLEHAVQVETSYENGKDHVANVEDLDKFEIISAHDIDMAIAGAKLRQ